jgi:hypothetical protein
MSKSYDILVEFDEFFDKGDFGIVDSLLVGIDIEKCEDVELVAYITASKWAKDKLMYRERFYERVYEEFVKRVGVKKTKELIGGLE